MNNIKIGLVKGLNYFDYDDLINNFLDELGVSYITSGKTTKKTIEDGRNLLVDESCLSLKIFFGHIYEIIDKCDYVLVIRSPSIKKREMLCTNFYAIYDLASNLFPNKIMEINIDVNNNIKLSDGFIKFGCDLGFSKKKSKLSFNKALEKHLKNKDEKCDEYLNLLKSNKKKILLAGHNYNLNDDYICGEIKKMLKDNDIEILLSSYYENIKSERYKIISKDIYWSKNINILNVIADSKNYVDGIILISTFPCGPDSLVNEMVIRNTNIPILNLVIDELNDSGGILTRIESFIDIIKMEENNYEY